MTNHALWRALHSLAHPVSLAAVALLLLNDHVFRVHSPSWLTGKLGDFTWLVFAPFICAALFACLIPRRIPRHENLVGALAFAFIGLWFALAKTVPAIHALTTSTVDALVGWKGTLRLDPTDLLTLPALLIGWTIWQRASNTPPTLSPRAWVMLALGVMATLASGSDEGLYHSVTDRGMTCIVQQDAALVSFVPTGGFSPNMFTVLTSVDGGLHWQSEEKSYPPAPSDPSAKPNSEIPVCSPNVNELVDPSDSQVVYRWRPGEAIEQSNDGGQTWIVDIDLSFLHQDIRNKYHRQNFDGGGLGDVQVIELGPHSGVIDPKTGNLVLAMGWDGVLVRTLDDAWHWVMVGDYYLENLTRFDQLPSSLFVELWLAGTLGFLIVTTSVAHIRRSRGFRIFLLLIGWESWLILTVIFLPPFQRDNNLSIVWLSLAVLVFLALRLSIGAVWDLARNLRFVAGRIALVAAGTTCLFLLPLVLWTQGTIPAYRTALLFSMLLTIASLFAGYQHLNAYLPIMPYFRKKKKPAEEEEI